MKIVQVVSPPALQPAPGPIPPREPGSLTAALGASYEYRELSRPPAACLTRDIKPRQSYAGGFQFPRKDTQTVRLTEAGGSWRDQDLNERWEAGGSYPKDGNAIETLEREISKLRQASHNWQSSRSRPGLVESFLHLDTPEQYRSHHGRLKGNTEQRISLEQLETLKRQHEQRLTDLEAEYVRSRQEPRTLWTSAATYSPVQSHPKPKSPLPCVSATKLVSKGT